jgi:SAM-dependent methyltransferase
VKENHQNLYRQRIYASYSSARAAPLAPISIEGLKSRLPYLRRLVQKYFPTDHDAAILELGCGHGALLYVLQQMGYQKARGVDGSQEQVAAAMQLGIAGVMQGDIWDALSKTSDASEDVVVAFDLIEHFTKDELIVLIDEVHRVLKPGGTWIIHVPNAESPFGSRVRHGDFTHELAFTRTSLAQVTLSSGFSNCNCFEDKPVAHGLTSTLRAGLWTLMRSALLFYIAVETGDFDRRAIFSQNLTAVAVRDN